MSEVIVEGRILAWGNSFGIRIRKEDLERSGLTPGAEVKVRIAPPGGRVDLSHIRFLEGGQPTDSERHDVLLGEARARDLDEHKARR